LAVLETCLGEVELVRAVDWQARIWERFDVPFIQEASAKKQRKRDTKACALLAVEIALPGYDWRATSRCSTPHDGLVDAYLIALDAQNERFNEEVIRSTKCL
jgi:hypothetical protein